MLKLGLDITILIINLLCSENLLKYHSTNGTF